MLKATSDLERMGDHAVSIAEATIRMKGEVRIPTVEEEINKMGRQVRQLDLEAVLDLYLHKNLIVIRPTILRPKMNLSISTLIKSVN